MTNTNAKISNDNDDHKTKPKTALEKINALYLNIQKILRDEEPQPELSYDELSEKLVLAHAVLRGALLDDSIEIEKDKRQEYNETANKIELIAKLHHYKNEGEHITVQEAREVYSWPVLSFTTFYDIGRASNHAEKIFKIPKNKAEEERLEKPTFEDVFGYLKKTVSNFRQMDAGEKTPEELGYNLIELGDGEPDVSNPAPQPI